MKNVIKKSLKYHKCLKLFLRFLNGEFLICTNGLCMYLKYCYLPFNSVRNITFMSHNIARHEAGKRTQEVGSCLRKLTLKDVKDTAEDLILWSDS